MCLSERPLRPLKAHPCREWWCAAEWHRTAGCARDFSRREKGWGTEIFIPPPVLCTDNAAMIAVAGNSLLCDGRRDGLDLNAVSRWPLD